MRSFARAVFAALSAPALFAQTGDKRLNLEDLVSEALKNNREVLAEQKRYEAMRQRPRQAGSLPDPVVSFGYNSNGNPLPLTGVGREPTSNIGVMMTQEFPYPGKRKLRAEIGGKEADAEFQQYQAAQLGVISRVKQAYYRLQHSYAEMEVLDRNQALLRTFLKITEVRYTAGKAAQQDVFKTQVQLSTLEPKRLLLLRERQAREAEINSLLNRSPGAPVAEPVEPHFDPLVVSIEELYARALENSPMLRKEQKGIERTELALNLAHKDYYPDYALSGGYFYMGQMPAMYTFRADFRIPLYFSHKQRPAVTEQAQNLSAARRSYESVEQALRYRVEDDYRSAETSARLIQIYRDTTIPQAHLALESSLSSYETGSVDFLSVLTNHLAILDYEMAYHEAMLDFHLALARLEETTGSELAH
jgi:outer membrane protein, heavy metal efflux system